MEDIEQFFIDLLNQNRSIDIAEAEFKRLVADDSELRAVYSDWCHEHGSSERMGFRDFCNEYRDSQDEVWDTLTDEYED